MLIAAKDDQPHRGDHHLDGRVVARQRPLAGLGRAGGPAVGDADVRHPFGRAGDGCGGPGFRDGGAQPVPDLGQLTGGGDIQQDAEGNTAELRPPGDAVAGNTIYRGCMGRILLIVLAVIAAFMILSVVISALSHLFWIAVIALLVVLGLRLAVGARRRSRR